MSSELRFTASDFARALSPFVTPEGTRSTALMIPASTKTDLKKPGLEEAPKARQLLICKPHKAEFPDELRKTGAKAEELSEAVADVDGRLRKDEIHALVAKHLGS